MSKPFNVKLDDGRNFRGLVAIAHMRKRFAVNLGGAGVKDADWVSFFPAGDGGGARIGLVTASVIPAMIHCFREILDNCIDEYQKGVFCKNVRVRLAGPYSFSVQDDGRGVPPELFKVFMTNHAGTNFGDDEAARGQNGLGAKAVRAVSSRFVVTSKIKGVAHRQALTLGPVLRKLVAGLPAEIINLFEEGLDPAVLIGAGLSRAKVQKAMEEDGCVPERLAKSEDPFAGRSGTIIEVSINPHVFSEERRRSMPDGGLLPEHDGSAVLPDVPAFAPALIDAICRETALVCPRMLVTFEDAKSSRERTYSFPDGLLGVARVIDRPHFRMTVKSKGENGKEFECEATLVAGSEGVNLSFVNGSSTRGGTHVDDLLTIVADEMRTSARDLKKMAKEIEITREDVRSALFLFVTVRMTGPSFSAQIKDVLTDTWIKPILRDMVARAMPKLYREAPEIIDAVASSARSRHEARKNREAEKTLKKNTKQRPLKLVDANTRDRKKAILFLAEGDSAAAGFRAVRDDETMGILPLKGVVLNCANVPFHRAIKNDEISSIVSSIGLPAPSEKNPGVDLNFGSVVILTDADVDGGHIRSLLITFFCAYWPWFVREGRLCRAVPPLFELLPARLAEMEEEDRPSNSGWPKFASSERERDSIVAAHPSEKLVTLRNKGLGEMGDAAWETTVSSKNCIVPLAFDEAAEETIKKWSDKDAASAAGRRADLSSNIAKGRTPPA